MNFEEYLSKQPTEVCYKAALTTRAKLEGHNHPVIAVSGGQIVTF